MKSETSNKIRVILDAIWNKDRIRSWLFDIWKELSSDKIEIYRANDSSYIKEATTKEYEFGKDVFDAEKHTKTGFTHIWHCFACVIGGSIH